MPIYDYDCPECHNIVEVIFPSWLHLKTDGNKVYCSNCHVLMERRPCAANFTFKGSGFYVNDYPKQSTK